MPDIFVMVRNQSNNALSSVGGVAFVTLLQQSDRLIDRQPVDWYYADASFDDLPLGEYAVIVAHDRVEPPIIKQIVRLVAPDDIVLLTFIYLEPERVFLRLETSIEKRL